MKITLKSKILILLGLIFVGSLALITIPVFASRPSSSIPNPITNLITSVTNSFNWSGYVATNGTFTGIGATWIVPNPSSGNGSPAADATWVGIGGVSSNNLIQADTESVTSSSGQIYFDAWIEKLPNSSQAVPLAVNPGDSITASITLQSENTWDILIKNNTTGQSFETTTQYPSSLASAEWIQEMPSLGRGFISLDSFGVVQFTNAWTIKNGTKVNITQAGGQPITMVNFSQQTLATPSVLNSDGASFTVTRSNASAITSFARRGWFTVRIGFTL